MTSVGLTWELGAEQGCVLHRAKDPLWMTGDAGGGEHKPALWLRLGVHHLHLSPVASLLCLFLILTVLRHARQVFNPVNHYA